MNPTFILLYSVFLSEIAGSVLSNSCGDYNDTLPEIGEFDHKGEKPSFVRATNCASQFCTCDFQENKEVPHRISGCRKVVPNTDSTNDIISVIITKNIEDTSKETVQWTLVSPWNVTGIQMEDYNQALQGKKILKINPCKTSNEILIYRVKQEPTAATDGSLHVGWIVVICILVAVLLGVGAFFLWKWWKRNTSTPSSTDVVAYYDPVKQQEDVAQSQP